MNQIVGCYSDVSYTEHPQTLAWYGKRCKIAEVLTGEQVLGYAGFRIRALQDLR